MTVTDCEMEADKNGDCLYDTLTLYDGKEECKIVAFVAFGFPSVFSLL